MNLQECKKRGLVKEVTADDSLISSLLKTSNNRFESAKRLELDKITASTKVSNYYDSSRELLEALAIKLGFKIYNHECYVCFLNEKCNDSLLSEEFNKFRIIRNQINYRGEDVNIEEAKVLIEDLINLRNKILNKFNEVKI